MSTEFHIGLCTCPDHACAETLAKALLEEKSAACINVMPNITSYFHWNNALQVESEVLLIIKTHPDHFPKIHKLLDKLHPYDCPEFITFPIEHAHSGYLEWLTTTLKTK